MIADLHQSAPPPGTSPTSSPHVHRHRHRHQGCGSAAPAASAGTPRSHAACSPAAHGRFRAVWDSDRAGVASGCASGLLFLLFFPCIVVPHVLHYSCGGCCSSVLFCFGGVAMLPSLSALSRSACRLGASGFACRPSQRALGGFVAVAAFSSAVSAGLFAKSWGAVLPVRCRGCVVRFSGGLAWVSVPVLPASAPSAVRAGAPLVAVGSPPAVRSAIAAGGVWSC